MRSIGAAMLFSLMLPASAAPSVMDLKFMMGSWAGPFGPNTLEETWNEPRAGTIAGVIRVSDSEGTAFVELIIINEEEDSLILRVQQFTPTYEALAPASTMIMTKLTEQSVTFESDTGSISELTYSRSGDETFTVEATTADGGLNAVLSKVD